jgi:hypothetical protein
VGIPGGIQAGEDLDDILVCAAAAYDRSAVFVLIPIDERKEVSKHGEDEQEHHD